MKILRVLTRPNLGGPMRQAVCLWHAHAALGHSTLLVTGRCDPDEAELAHDLPLASDPASDPNGTLTLQELGRGIHPFRDRSARQRLAQLIRAVRPDVVHTHTSKAGLIGRGLARRLGVPVVAHTYHGIVLRDYFPVPVTWGLRWVERRLARATHLNFAVSESCRRELAEFKIRDVEVVPPAVDVRAARGSDRAAARAELGIDADAFVVGFVGRLVRVKRVEVFLELAREIPDATFVVCGDGPLRDVVQPLVGPFLKWLGATDRAPSLLAAFDVLVLPSRREGFPLVCVEAAAAGVPCIGYDVPGVHDAVEASHGGALVPSDAGVEALRAAVETVRATPAPPDDDIVDLCDPARVASYLSDRYATMLGAHD